MIHRLDKEGLRDYIRALQEVSTEHPLRETYEDVVRGKKTWKDYHEHLRRLIREEGQDAIDVALYHVWKTLKDRKISGRERAFWKLADRVTAYADRDWELGRAMLTEIHKHAVEYGKTYDEVLEHPEYWRTLIGTAFVEHMDYRTIKEGLQRVDDAIAKLHPAKIDALRYPMEYARTVMELAEMLLKRPGLTASQKRLLAEISAAAAIRMKTIAVLRNRK